MIGCSLESILFCSEHLLSIFRHCWVLDFFIPTTELSFVKLLFGVYFLLNAALLVDTSNILEMIREWHLNLSLCFPMSSLSSGQPQFYPLTPIILDYRASHSTQISNLFSRPAILSAAHLLFSLIRYIYLCCSCFFGTIVDQYFALGFVLTCGLGLVSHPEFGKKYLFTLSSFCRLNRELSTTFYAVIVVREITPLSLIVWVWPAVW